MSKELLPELPKQIAEWYDEIDKEVVRTYAETGVIAYGQACYEAGRKSVDLEQFRDAVNSWLSMSQSNSRFGYDHVGHEYLNEQARNIKEANRLLAVIDGEKS